MMESILLAVSPDDDAMARVAQGDNDALAILFERHKTRLFGFLYHLVGERALAEDLLGETFLRLYQARKQYRRGGGFVPWMLAIARNLALGELRRKNVANRAQERLTRDAGTEDVGCEMERAEECARVRQALQGLPEDQRTALVLKEYHELSYAEIAQVLRCTEQAARARTYRARLALRDALRDWWQCREEPDVRL